MFAAARQRSARIQLCAPSYGIPSGTCISSRSINLQAFWHCVKCFNGLFQILFLYNIRLRHNVTVVTKSAIALAM